MSIINTNTQITSIPKNQISAEFMAVILTILNNYITPLLLDIRITTKILPLLL